MMEGAVMMNCQKIIGGGVLPGIRFGRKEAGTVTGLSPVISVKGGLRRNRGGDPRG